MKKITRFPLYVFDLAGTIIDANCQGPLVFLKKAFEQNKIAVSEQQIIKHMGNSKKKHIDLILEELKNQDKKLSNKLYKSYLHFQGQEIHKFCELTQGTKEAFDLLKQKGIKVGITTGYDSVSVMRTIVQQLHKQNFYPDSVQWSTPQISRPMPDMINAIKKELKIPDNEIAVKFDDCEVGIQEGRNANCLTVGIYGTSTYQPWKYAIQKLKSADLVAVDVLEAVKKLI